MNLEAQTPDPHACLADAELAALRGKHCAHGLKPYSVSLQNWMREALRTPTLAEALANEVHIRLSRVGDSLYWDDPVSCVLKIATHVTSEWGSPDEDRRDLQEELATILQRLPLQCRSVVLLCNRSWQTHAEAAAHLSLSLDKVERDLARARVMFFDGIRTRARDSSGPLHFRSPA